MNNLQDNIQNVPQNDFKEVTVLSPEKTNAMVKRMMIDIDQVILDPILSKYSCIVSKGIIDGIYDPDLFLASSIRECRYATSLYFIGVLLRLSNEPNIYFQTKEGPMHILAYVTYIFDNLNKELDLYRKVIILCIMNGATYNYDYNDESGTTVEDYVKAKGFEVISYLENKSTPFANLCAIYLDKPDIYSDKKLQFDIDVYTSIVISISQNFIREFIFNCDILVPMCIRSGNYIILREIVDISRESVKSNVSYSDLNILCYNLYADNKAYEIFMEVLLICFDVGITIDNYQFKLIDPGSSTFKNKLKEIIKPTNKISDETYKRVLNRLILSGLTRNEILDNISIFEVILNTEYNLNIDISRLDIDHKYITIFREIDAISDQENIKYKFLAEKFTKAFL